MSDWLDGRLAELREHPRHVVLGALVAGLLAIPLAPPYALLLAVAAAVLAGRPLVALLAAAAVLVGAVGGQARLAALDHTALPPHFGTTVIADAVLLEQPSPVQYGATALAEVRGIAVASKPPRGGAANGGGAGVGLTGSGGPALISAAAGERVMLRLLSRTRWPGVATSEVVRVSGRLRALGPFEQYYARKGAHAAITLDTAEATGAHRGGVWRAVDIVRGRAERALSVGLARPQAALLRGMVLGQDEALDERTQDEFQDAGLSHVLAASGQNVALLLALALPLLALAGLEWRPRLAVAIGLIALYVPLAGAGPSIQRAGVMGAATTAAAMAGRAPSRWYALLLAAAVTLLLNPRAAADPGWQLSFAAVVAIALATPAISERLKRRRVPAAIADPAAMSLAATIGTAPLIAYEFDQLSLVSLAANVLAEPAIAPLMWLGMIAAALGQLAAPLAIPLNALNAYLLGYVGAVAHVAAGLPHASVTVAIPGLVTLIAIYAALAVVIALARRGTSGSRGT